MTAADSVPSQCMNCFVNYYRQGYVPDTQPSKIYFCETCRIGLSEREWGILEKFHRLLSQAWIDFETAGMQYEAKIYDVDYRLARTHALRIIYESLQEGVPREAIFNVFNTFKLSDVLHAKLLDLLELLEEYDTVIKEKHNGQSNKTSTNT